MPAERAIQNIVKCLPRVETPGFLTVRFMERVRQISVSRGTKGESIASWAGAERNHL